MNLKLSVILGFILAVLTDLVDSAATTCNDTLQCSSCVCVSTNNSMTFAKGDNTTLCAHFVTVENTTGCTTAYRAAYPVVVDTFSSIQLTGGQLYFQNYSSNYSFVGIVIQAYGNVTSVPLTYLQLTEFYSSAFSIIIELNNGVVQSAYWDHQCATCSSSDCYQFSMSNGTLIDNICNSPSCITANDSSSCDPQIYVAWIGTDSNGNQLTSAGMRLSRFDQFSLSDIVSASTIPTYVPIPYNATNSTNSSTSGGSTNGTTNTTDSNKTDTTNTTTSGNTTNTTDSSGNKTDTNTTTTNTTTTNTTDSSGNKTDTNTTTTNTTDTNKTTTETSTSTSSSDSGSSSSGSSSTTTGSSTTGTDTSSTKGDTTTTPTTDTSTSSGSSTTDAGSSTSTGTDTSTTKDDPTTVTK